MRREQLAPASWDMGALSSETRTLLPCVLVVSIKSLYVIEACAGTSGVNSRLVQKSYPKLTDFQAIFSSVAVRAATEGASRSRPSREGTSVILLCGIRGKPPGSLGLGPVRGDFSNDLPGLTGQK